MAVQDPSGELIEDVRKMVGAEYCVGRDLEKCHGVKSIAQSRENYQMRVVAHDDYAILSKIQTVCAWHQCGFAVESAGRVDGDIVVWFYVVD